jgi:oligoendopeptidase F
MDSIAKPPAAGSPPAWDLSPEYHSFDDPEFAADLARVDELVAELENIAPAAATVLHRAETLEPESEQSLLDLIAMAFALGDEITARFGNLCVYTNCIASVDGRDERAKALRGQFASMGARVDKAWNPVSLLLARASEDFVRAALERPQAVGHAFRIGQTRKYRGRLLDLNEENVVSALAPDGLDAWGRLYDSITGTAKARLKPPSAPEREIGLSEAAALLRDSDRDVREAAFRAQTEAFAAQEESLAAILNSLAGWRLAEYGMRSREAPLHFLDVALSSNRLERATLDAMFAVVDENREMGRRALRAQARLMGLPRIACWDTLAPAPRPAGAEPRNFSFEEALGMVRAAYSAVDPAMGDFVLEMLDGGRIEARVLAAKRPGAYCTRFPKSRTPRVFMTYRGSLSDVSTLAHELGHAYHGRLLAALPLAETSYPMNLAETASTFAETALADYLGGRADGQKPDASVGYSDLVAISWADAQDAASFLINIPARFAFEKTFYEARAKGPLGAAALSELMGSIMREYYGDSLSEVDAGFWRSKLHYYMSGLSFYNFPYTFGYLFSLGVYSRRELFGPSFHERYCALLRDAGRMETEDLAQKHLGVDLRKPDFWRASCAIVARKVERFENLVDKLAPALEGR